MNRSKFSKSSRIFFLLLLPFFLNGQKLCDEVISSVAVRSSESQLNRINSLIREHLGTALSKTGQCSYIPRENLGELKKYFEDEKLIEESFSGIPSGVSKNFSQKSDITYVAFIKTRYAQLGNLKGGRSKIVFHSLYQGSAKISFEVEFTLIEFEKLDSEIRNRIELALKPYFNCDEIDDKISRLNRDLNNTKLKLNQLFDMQRIECSKIQGILDDLEDSNNKFKRENKRLFDYLKDQKKICEDLDLLLKRIDIIENDLRTARQEKDTIEETNPPPLPPQDPEQDPRPDPLIFMRQLYSSLSKKSEPCLGGKEYYITDFNSFKQKSKEKRFKYIQFAILPDRIYNPCDFNIFYSQTNKRVILIDRKNNFGSKARYVGLIGPFLDSQEMYKVLTFVRSQRYYSGAKEYFIQY